jgi:hypothetical protein
MSEDMRLDLRYARAQQVTHALLQEVMDYIPSKYQSEAFRKIEDFAHKYGLEIVSDEMRQIAGLQPRDDKGWTPDELIALERARLEAMISRVSAIVPDSFAGERRIVILDPEDKPA